MTDRSVCISVDLTEAEARYYALFLKRVGYDYYKELCRDAEPEAPFRMLGAGEKLRDALRQAGVDVDPDIAGQGNS